MRREKLKQTAFARARVPMRGTGAEALAVEMKVLQWDWIEGAPSSGDVIGATLKGRTSVDKAKPFCIAKRDVWEAYKRVKANRGSAGVDQSRRWKCRPMESVEKR